MVGLFHDLIGVWTPVVVSFKVLIQEICESRMDWDQPLVEPQAKKWHELVTKLRKAQLVLQGGTVLDLWARKTVEAESSEQNHQTH